MPDLAQAFERLSAITPLTVRRNARLSDYTRFGLGGPAAILVETSDKQALTEGWAAIGNTELPRLIIGGGTNLVVSDAGYQGIIFRFNAISIAKRAEILAASSGAVLQDVVDFSIDAGLSGIHTMTGIPGSLGGAVYGNAGAYGRSLHQSVESVLATNGGEIRTFSNADCGFGYRESNFKRDKTWVILSTELRLSLGDRSELKRIADEIRTIRDAKYPPSMKCAGSIFKNVFFAELPGAAQAEVPEKLIREGKVPSAWFLEQAGVKGMRRGDIQVAEYHANLIYNDGNGTAADLRWVIDELKRRVHDRFGFYLEEEVQYVGFE